MCSADKACLRFRNSQKRTLKHTYIEKRKYFDEQMQRKKRNYWFEMQKEMDRVKRIWYLSPMRAAKVQASLRIRAVSPEPPLLAHTSSESSGTFRQKARSLAPGN